MALYFTIINSLLFTGLDETLQTLSVSIGTLQMFPFIYENSPLPCIIAIFLNIIFLEIRNFSGLLRFCSTLGVTSTSNLLHTAWQGIFPFETFLLHVKQIYNLLLKVAAGIKTILKLL